MLELLMIDELEFNDNEWPKVLTRWDLRLSMSPHTGNLVWGVIEYPGEKLIATTATTARLACLRAIIPLLEVENDL